MLTDRDATPIETAPVATPKNPGVFPELFGVADIESSGGLCLRDLVAIAGMVGILINSHTRGGVSPERLADTAYQFADAVMARRQR